MNLMVIYLCDLLAVTLRRFLIASVEPMVKPPPPGAADEPPIMFIFEPTLPLLNEGGANAAFELFILPCDC